MRFTLNTSDRAPAPLEPLGGPLVNICAVMDLLFLAVNWINEDNQSCVFTKKCLRAGDRTDNHCSCALRPLHSLDLHRNHYKTGFFPPSLSLSLLFSPLSLFLSFETESHLTQTGYKLPILLPPPRKCWYHMLPHTPFSF